MLGVTNIVPKAKPVTIGRQILVLEPSCPLESHLSSDISSLHGKGCSSGYIPVKGTEIHSERVWGAVPTLFGRVSRSNLTNF